MISSLDVSANFLRREEQYKLASLCRRQGVQFAVEEAEESSGSEEDDPDSDSGSADWSN